MDSFDWSKKYDILSISRLFLRDAVKFPTQQVNELTDEDMQRIADMVEPVRIFGPCKSCKIAMGHPRRVEMARPHVFSLRNA